MVSRRGIVKWCPVEGVEKGVVLTEGEYKIRPYRKRQHKTVWATTRVAHFSTPAPGEAEPPALFGREAWPIYNLAQGADEAVHVL